MNRSHRNSPIYTRQLEITRKLHTVQSFVAQQLNQKTECRKIRTGFLTKHSRKSSYTR